jgi:hypothetical protein
VQALEPTLCPFSYARTGSNPPNDQETWETGGLSDRHFAFASGVKGYAGSGGRLEAPCSRAQQAVPL